MNYEFAQKNHWRNRIWNELHRRVKVHPRDAVILYLAAESDFDRATALKKGFRNENLIAIDRDIKVVERIRERGGLCIHGDFFDVAAAWPESVPVSAMIGDFVCGLEDKIMTQWGAIYGFNHLRNTIFIGNVMRGRDPSSGPTRNFVQLLDPALRHRGLVLALSSLVNAIRLGKEICDLLELRELQNSIEAQSVDLSVAILKKDFSFLLNKIDACSGSYKSTAGSLYFDWVIWNNPCQSFLPGLTLATSAMIEGRGVNPEPKAWRIYLAMKRKIAATLAHRTRRAMAA